MKYWQLLWFIFRNFKIMAKMDSKEFLLKMAERNKELTSAMLENIDELNKINLVNSIYNPSDERKEQYRRILEAKSGNVAKILLNGDILIGGAFGTITLKVVGMETLPPAKEDKKPERIDTTVEPWTVDELRALDDVMNNLPS